jgi:UDP-2,3-diacylglucosamine hydrolase
VREASDLAKAEKAMAIMDANAEAIAACLREYGYPRLIHGHTHRPARHQHQVDGRVCERYVLADWYQRASYLECDAAGCRALPEAG